MAWAAVSVGLLVAAAGGLLRHQLLELSTANLRERATLHAWSIGAQVDFYRSILRSLSYQPAVHDILVLGNRPEAQAWARQTRTFLPGVLGLALATPDGGIMGAPPALRVGPSCLADIRRRLAGQAADDGPVIHRDMPGLAHFDLMETVADDDGQLAGILFGSFRLDQLDAALAHAAGRDELLILYGPGGREIARGGHGGRARALSVQAPVPGTGWTLALDALPPAMLPRYLPLAATAFLGGVAIILLVAWAYHRLGRGLVQDLEGVRRMLEGARDGVHRPPPAAAVQDTQRIVDVAADIVDEINRQKEVLAQLSLTDDLTGLANRRRFRIDAEYALGLADRDTAVCLALIDLDHFKQVNDRLGHAAGDRVLQIMADVLRTHCRRSDQAARTGGDEFAVILNNVEPALAVTWLERMAEDFRRRQQNDPALKGGTPCTLSCGLVLADPRIHDDVDDLVKAADKALYEAKNAGRDRIHVAASGGA